MKRSIIIVGGGSAALMLAAQLDKTKFSVGLYEKNNALGRKFLVAGDGGFNLTHSENIENFIQRYDPSSFFVPLLKQFSNDDLRNYLRSIGIETYVGSSKRVFPLKGIKPIEVLNAFLKQIRKNNVEVFTKHEWKGWNSNNELVFHYDQGIKTVKSDIVVFALGGGSWSVTGSDGSWLNHFDKKGISVLPFQSSNCAFKILWSDPFLVAAEGKSLKNIAITSGGKTKKGEVVITKFGIEGGAIYALSAQIREQLKKSGEALIFINMKPLFEKERTINLIKNRGNSSISKVLKEEIRLNNVAVELLRSGLSKEDFTDPVKLADKIHFFPLIIEGVAPIDDAISTVGGISLDEIDADFQLKKMHQNFVIGEMLNWDAPTGGYLLQACLSMGFVLAKHLNATR